MYFLFFSLPPFFSLVSLLLFLFCLRRSAAAVTETACAALEQSPTPLTLPLPVNVRSPISSQDSQSSKASAGGEETESARNESKLRNASFACQDRAFLPAPASTGAAGATSKGIVKSKAMRAPDPFSGESGLCRAEQRARETVVGEWSGEGERGGGERLGSAAMKRANAAATSSSVGNGGGVSGCCGSALTVTRLLGAGRW